MLVVSCEAQGVRMCSEMLLSVGLPRPGGVRVGGEGGQPWRSVSRPNWRLEPVRAWLALHGFVGRGGCLLCSRFLSFTYVTFGFVPIRSACICCVLLSCRGSTPSVLDDLLGPYLSGAPRPCSMSGRLQ